MAKHNQLGQLGEEVAVSYLIGKGYKLLERNWHSSHKELDMIAESVRAAVAPVPVETYYG